MAELKVYSLFDTKTQTINLTGNSAVLIRGHSTAEIIMGADGVINLDTVIIKNGSAREYGIAMDEPMRGYVRATFPNVQTDTFSVSCEDGDGNMVRKDVVAYMMVDYINLTCNVLNMRPDANGNMSLYCYGNYFNGSFGKVTNTLTVQYRYRKAGGSWSSYTSMTVSKSGNGYTAQANLSGLDYEATYEFEYRASDQLMTVDTALSGVSTLPVFHWGANDFAFEVPVDFKRKGVSGLSISDYLGFSGSTSMITPRSSTQLDIYAPILNLSYAVLLQNGNTAAFAEYGTWTPELYGIHPTTRAYKSCFGNLIENRGWYSKSGNIVTVGFRIKFDCLDNSNDNYIVAIRMNGLPIPVYAASGGGLCSGALMDTSKNFQCFVAETDGYITTRTQACDYTSGSILATSKDGCRYTYSSDELTLSGTITYMTA